MPDKITKSGQRPYGKILAFLALIFGLLLWNCSKDKPIGNGSGDPSNDSIPPAEVTSLSVDGKTSNSVTLSWVGSDSADADTILVIYRTDGDYPGSVTDGTTGAIIVATETGTTLTGLTENTTYNISVFVRDTAGNWSTGAQIEVTTDPDGGTCTLAQLGETCSVDSGCCSGYCDPDLDQCATGPSSNDTVPPETVTSLTIAHTTQTSVALTWVSSTSADADSIVVVYRGDGTYADNVFDGTVGASLDAAGTGVTVDGFSAGSTYNISVFVKDTAGNWSTTGAQITATTDSVSTDTTCTLAQVGDTCSVAAECCSEYCNQDVGRCDLGPDGCDANGVSCVSGATCCSGRCGLGQDSSMVCVGGIASCAAVGESCQNAADCCSQSTCEGGQCVTDLCKVQGDSCAENSECCGNNCENGTCESGGTCLTAGEECSTGDACCSRTCLESSDGKQRCHTGGWCRTEGEVCAENADCCNAKCTDGTCEKLQECAVVGEACSEDSECCSYGCRDDGTGFKSCQYLGGCRPFGELCRQDTDCCNDALDRGPGVCDIFDTTLMLGTCANPTGCAPAGEICEGGAHECCPGNPEGQEFCRPTSIGVLRCWVSDIGCQATGATCTDNADCCSGVCTDGQCGDIVCLEDNVPCAFGDQCCSGVCSPNDAGVLVCNPKTCLEWKEACTADSDCCDPMFCYPETNTCLYPD